MKCTIPEISWHNRDPVLSVDIQLKQEKDNQYRVVTGGADSHVFIWYLTEGESGIANVEFASDLSRHQKAVNVVRFSPDGELLASGDDESTIIVWKQKTDQDLPEFPIANNMDEDNTNKEHWIVHKVLRGHLEDVYDISWSPTSTHLISGSVDNTAILWNVHKGKNLGILSEHKKFVQGVAWDPKDQYVATLSSDRSLRTYSIQSKKVIARACRAKLPVPPSHELHDKLLPLFHDDTMKSFFRRLCFSPDGSLLIAPSGVFENSDTGKKPTSVTHVFTRACLNKPAICLPSLQYYSVAVKCCPVLFELKPSDEEPLFKLPYRIVIAVATENNILLYDTQHATPFAFIANIHYTKLTDITWSSDGRILIASSTDGYCSIISFGDKEIGIPYVQINADDSKENIPNSEDKVQTNVEKSQQKSEVKKLLSEKPLIANDSESNRKENISESKENATKNDKSPIVPELKPERKNDSIVTNVPVQTMEVDVTAPSNTTSKDAPECPTTPKTPNKTSSGTPNKTPRRVQLITLSSPNRKRKMDEEKIKETIQLNDSKKLFEVNDDKNVKKKTGAEEDVCMEEVKSEPKADEQLEQDKIKEKADSNEPDPSEDKLDKAEEKNELDDCKKSAKEKCSSPVVKSELKNVESVCNKTVDFDFDCVLENTGDSILNPSFVDDSPRSHKHPSKSANDFSSLSETLSKKSTAKNTAISAKSCLDDTSKDECKTNTVSGEVSDVSALTSPSRESGAKPSHVFTPPRAVHSPKLGTPGRRVQLITLSSPKVKPKDK